MKGFKFNFETGDIVVSPQGVLETAQIDCQNIVLIGLSQVCRLTRPEFGAQIGSKIVERHSSDISSLLATVKKQAENDGATNVVLQLTSDNKLIFTGVYDS